ncbi:hypothetical protein NitYY0826_P27 (plasmid) [Nitratiruptor sp. YY08-26]|uniref:peptidylprolyl isomerase n=1 Tax=unclassified Nitratiruptor TaxID=2624044 RepID=UPI0018ECD587|nr:MULTISPECIES: peptidylprolyl isomerase [unclassified Nitratiruptor]BCD63186.1 hypothetical protein NitYY0813_P27 [Nitratiruptor sp. YY08-13]BCD67122.1 hypothetical protein NitYY0826_P27 [Nitratiruptor sp. YY08-26]
MKRYFLAILLIATFSYGLQLSISPDKNVSVTKSDIDALKFYTKEKFHFIMNEDGAKKIAKENRILANAYLKEGLLTPFKKRVILIQVEKELADQYVKRLQKSIHLSEKVLKSYYYDHLKQFKKSDEVQLVQYRFKTFEDALTFYRNPKKGLKYTKKNVGWKELNRIVNPYRAIISSTKVGGYTPPFVVGKNTYDIFYVKNKKINKDSYIPFEKVKKNIAEILYKKTFDRAREKVLEKYQ